MQASAMSSFSQASPSQAQTSQPTQAVTPTQPVIVHTNTLTLCHRFVLATFSPSVLFYKHLSSCKGDFLLNVVIPIPTDTYLAFFAFLYFTCVRGCCLFFIWYSVYSYKSLHMHATLFCELDL